jgi:glutathione S-transferase
MTVELYVFPPSPRAFKVMAIANHLGIDTTLHIVDLVKGDQKTPQYAAINPNMRIPTLKDGDYVLWETSPARSREAVSFRRTNGHDST